jgi:hypothetical protein
MSILGPHTASRVTHTASRVTLTASPVLLLCGCFSYVQVPLDTVPVGEDIRVYVSRQALQELPEMPEGNSPILTGKLIRRENERLFISVPFAQRQEGFFISQIGQEVGVRTGEIVQLEIRKLDHAKTGLFVAGTAAAAAAVVYTIMEAAGRSDNPDPPLPEDFRVLRFSFPMRK